MLQQFTWQEFLVAIGALALVWYAVVILLFYRGEFIGLFQGRPGVSDLTARRRVLPGAGGGHFGLESLEDYQEAEQEEFEDFPLGEEEGDSGEPGADLMGKPKLPEGMSKVSVSQISFGEDDRLREMQQGLVPDVLREIREVLDILAKEDGSKQDFFKLMRAVKDNYPGIASSPQLARINDFIAVRAPFFLGAEELEDLWV